MELYIQEYGSKLKKSRDSFVVVKDEVEKLIAPCQLDAIVIESGVSITTDAIELAVQNEIPIVLTDELGTVLGKFWEAKYPSTPKIRRNQLKYFDTPFATEMAKKWVIKKIEHQKLHSQRLERSMGFGTHGIEKSFEKEMKKIALCKGTPEETRVYIMACEARASEAYYNLLKFNLPGIAGFKKREHQEAKDPYNAMLNYIFGCLYKKIDHYMTLAGLEPYIGIFHTDGYNKASLIYDFAEQFRNIAYEIAYSTAVAHEINKHFMVEQNGKTIINSEERKKLVKKFHEKMKRKMETDKGEKISVEEHMRNEIRAIVKELENHKVEMEEKGLLKSVISKIWV